ncbi:MAG: GerW family sporulation protein, partial [Bacillota bacterium]|nr:GerW family sporulation protein [Bacillota bacterium]
PMEKNHPVSELMAETIQKIKEAVDANTVVGQPITAGEVTIIPVSRISLGFGTGGSEFGGKAPKNLGENPFGGGGGAGLKVIPVGFLVVSGTSVKMLPVDTATESPADRLMELIPDLLEQVSKKWEERKAKKQAEPEITEEDLV